MMQYEMKVNILCLVWPREFKSLKVTFEFVCRMKQFPYLRSMEAQNPMSLSTFALTTRYAQLKSKDVFKIVWIISTNSRTHYSSI